MANLPKQILNYFATFTETRFNFNRLINYRWTSDELTLDLSLFPKFQSDLLNKIKSGNKDSISVKRGEYALTMPRDLIIERLDERLREDYNTSYLEACISEFSSSSGKPIEVTETGQLMPAQNDEEAVSDTAWREGVRKYNIALRKELENILITLQEQIINNKKAELGINHIPQSTFGMTNYLQEHFNTWQSLAKETKYHN